MKKKSPRGVPDFARHDPRAKDGGRVEPTADKRPGARKPAPPPPPRAKPQATSSKSGQRGQ